MSVQVIYGLPVQSLIKQGVTIETSLLLRKYVTKQRQTAAYLC